jgi:transcriptional regulator GlxA family with amidase domain
MKLAIALTEYHRLLSVAAMIDVFETVNRFKTEEGLTAPFEIVLLEEHGHNRFAYEGYIAQQPVDDVQFDIILIPAFREEGMANALTANKRWLSWLRGQYDGGAAIASFCTGAFLLAASGLLDGKPATTHINAGSAFVDAFPNVKLQNDAVVTEEDKIFTSGGATNSFHLMLRLIEIYCGRAVAVRAAKVFSIDPDRNTQSYFGSFTPVKDHSDALVKLAQEEIRKNFNKAVTIEEIVVDVPSSRRNLVRRFKQVTGITPIEYLQKTRIEAAKQLLEQSRHSITQIMFESGYNDLKTFRSLFKKNVGMTPKSYREKFNAHAVQ